MESNFLTTGCSVDSSCGVNSAVLRVARTGWNGFAYDRITLGAHRLATDLLGVP